MATTYDAKRFTEAHQRYLADPKTTTDEDIELFTLISPTFAERARAKRAGFVDAYDAKETKFLATPITQKHLLDWTMDFFDPLLMTYKFKAAETAKRIDELEQRNADLRQRLAEVEAYCQLTVGR